MKKLLLIILYSISCYSYAEVNRELYNNYIIFAMTEVSPHSIPIKLQSITSSVIPTKKLTMFDKPKFLFSRTFIADKLIIKSTNGDGLITYIESKKLFSGESFGYKKVIDYNKKTSVFFPDYKMNSSISKLIFNQNNLITHVGSANYIYDKNNYITTRIYNGDRYKSNIKYDYTAYGFLKSSCDTSNMNTPSNILKNEYFYDNDNRLAKLIVKIYSGENLSSQSECDFSDYNKYGDWTIAKCTESDDDIYIEQVKRELEY